MSTRRELANAIRALSMDAIQQANSGHPGAPMGMADMAEVLWNDHLKHNPANPGWWDRDRFVLSNGHASMLLYSQAATTKALMPAALALGVSPTAAIAAFAAVSALFVLPTYPSLLAAVEFDDTGSTRIGKYVFDHPFLIPGTVTIASSVMFGFIFGGLIL